MRSHLTLLHATRKFLGDKTDQGTRDYLKLIDRLKINGMMVEIIEASFKMYYNGRVKAQFMLNVANEIAQRLNLTVDRLARRNRKALLCWFAENWQIISKIFPETVSNFSKSESILDEKEEDEQSIDPSNYYTLLNVR